ncbi:MAG: L-serine ammonia-lyase, iron-sulfur-dependent subunit beta [Clostridium sp.]
MNIFDILGPVMVGPSSSHTAGAVRIGSVTKRLLGAVPTQAIITLSGSFSSTGVGHGTDKALIAGLLGLTPDDMRIPNSFALAKEANLQFTFLHSDIKGAHPNTALLDVTAGDDRHINLQASSLGGGRIMINKLDGVEIDVTGEKPILIIHNIDRPGYVSEVTSMLTKKTINIATMTLHRNKRGGDAVMVIETDQNIPSETIDSLKSVDGILKVACLNL